MAKIRRLVLDTLKPHEPNIIDLADVLTEIEGVSSVNISIYELDRMVEARQALTTACSISPVTKSLTIPSIMMPYRAPCIQAVCPVPIITAWIP